MTRFRLKLIASARVVKAKLAALVHRSRPRKLASSLPTGLTYGLLVDKGARHG